MNPSDRNVNSVRRRTQGFLLLLLATMNLAQAHAQEDKPYGMDRVSKVLKQMVRFELDEYGRLQLRKDHWRVAAKRFSVEALRKARTAEYRKQNPKATELAIGYWSKPRFSDLSESDNLSKRLNFQTMTEAVELWKMFRYVAIANESHSPSWTRRPGGWSAMFSADASRKAMTFGGDCEIIGDRVELRLRERLPGGFLKRRIWMDTRRESVFLLLVDNAGHFFQILQAKKMVHISGTTADGIVSAQGSSFVELAKQHPDVLEALRGTYDKFHLGRLPVREAATATPKPYAQSTVKPVVFPDGALTTEQTVEFMNRLSPVMLVKDRLRFNRAAKLNQLEHTGQVLDDWREAIEAKGDRWDLYAPEVRVHVSGVKDWLRISADARHTAGSVLFNSFAYPDHIDFWIANARPVGRLRESGLYIMQTASGLVIMNLVGKDEVLSISGTNYLSLLSKHEALLRTRFTPVLEKFGFTGWNPLNPKTVAAVVKKLSEDRDDTARAAPTDSSSREVDALIANKQYLNLLLDRVDTSARKHIANQISKLEN